MPTETIRRVREAAIERAKTHGWERERPKHDYVDETREVKGRDLPETVRDELRRTFDERLAPLAREQCMIDEKMKFENHEFYVVKYDAVNFPSVAQHVDEKHVTFLVSLNNVTEYAGGGNQFQGMGFSARWTARASRTRRPGATDRKRDHSRRADAPLVARRHGRREVRARRRDARE
jgi:hypothetical protein